jgi:hypothetical protein
VRIFLDLRVTAEHAGTPRAKSDGASADKASSGGGKAASAENFGSARGRGGGDHILGQSPDGIK